MKKIKLTRGMYAEVDDENYEALNKHKWNAHLEGRTHYAIRTVLVNGKYVTERMHRVIMGNVKDGFYVDHINGDGLCNLKSNLRVVNKKQNQQNVKSHIDSNSKYLGVSYRKSKNTYRARIFVDGKELSLGHYKNEIDAAKAYNEAAIKYRGEYANINKI